MATAGIFTLITNDGKQDRMLMATDVLRKRLEAVQRKRRDAGEPDTTPTLLDIERTHVLFMNAHFKPFCAIGYEYQKVQPDSGGATLGTEVRFSIPQFGDFFNDMALYIKYNEQTYTPTAAAPNQDVFRYCDFPGERIMQNVKFDVNGNPLDEYNVQDYPLYRNVRLQPNKRDGWWRLVGQELPVESYLQQETLTQPTSRCQVLMYNGYQTPKGAHPALVTLTPLLFWCNLDTRLSVPSVSIPYGQRFIRILLASAAQLVQVVTPPGADGSDAGTLSPLTINTISLYINNIFVNPEIHDIFIKRIGFTLIRVHRNQTTRQDKDMNNVLLNLLKWPIETFYLMMQPVSNADPNNPKSLQTWHRFSGVEDVTEDLTGVASSAIDSVAKTQITAILAAADVAGTAAAQMAAYMALAHTTSGAASVLAIGAAAATATGATSTTVYNAVQLAGNAPWWSHPVVQGASTQVDMRNYFRTVDRLSVQAHGIELYREFPSIFYDSYIPWNYGGQNITTPQDLGILMVNFTLYPGSYQPAGHVNVSRAREFYVQYWSGGAVSVNTPADMIVIASAINFLLISDGSAVLRYST